MDGDDISRLDRLEEQVSFLQHNNNIDIVGSFMTIIDLNGNEKGKIQKPTEKEKIKNKLLLFLTIAH